MKKVNTLTSTSEIIQMCQQALSDGKPVQLGRWLMLPNGRVARYSNQFRSLDLNSSDLGNFHIMEICCYGVKNFVKAWINDN
jgi:hypothetical protein